MRRHMVTVRALAWTVSFCLIFGAVSFVPFTSIAATTPSPVLDDESPDEGARQFDEGVRDVGTILNLDLSTENGVRQAAEIFKRNEKKLAKFEKKALQAAMRVASFQKGLKGEASKRKGGDAELATELESNPGAVGKIPGAEEAAEAIKSSTKPAAETLQRLAEVFKKAGDAAKQKHAPAKSHHAKSKNSETGSPAIANPSSNISPELFCASYQYICDILTRAALYRLRATLAAIHTGTRKANCVVSAYSSYTSCVIAHWWDQAYCLSRLSSQINFCLTYA